MVKKTWPAQLNKLVWEKRNNKKAIVLSIGQVVPHEVMGMANFNKNMFIGVGGLEAINLSHFIGAVYGMENMMGKADNPLRRILNYASEHFLGELDLWYILTVVGSNPTTGKLEMKGLFIGNDIECYTKACELSMKVNFTILEKAPSKMVVYLDEDEFHSTWLGNKAIYRTRMAIADEGELIVLAPGIKRFGEDDGVDVLIRKYGYVGTPKVMKAMEDNQELKDSLGTVAHIIHGSSEGRFSVTYCPGHLTRAEIESVGFKYASLDVMAKKYDVDKLQDGWQKDAETGEEFFFIKNPALGLWAVKSKFENKANDGSVAKKPRIE
jgi:nickel-dependent lactate racemase